MMSSKQFATLLGFLFVAAWVGFSFGEAVLCLLGGGLFYVIAGLVQGDLDLGDLQSRVTGKS